MQTLQPINHTQRDPDLVFVGVPATRGGLWDLARTLVSLELGVAELSAANVKTRFVFHKCAGQGVAKARNMLTFAARCTPASRMILVDADIKPTPADFFRLLSHRAPFVGALYPKKNLERLCWVGEFEEATEETMGPGGLWPMMSVGSGFVRVDMAAVDSLIAAHPGRAYMNDEDEPSSGIADGQWMHDLWGMGVVEREWFGSPKHPKRRTYPRYVTEDYFFSMLYREMGGKLWTDPGCIVGHVGEVDFLALHNAADRRVDEALRAYKADLVKAGVKVPLLQRELNGTASIARIN